MARVLVAGLCLAWLFAACGCVESSAAAGGGKRVIVMNPRSAGPVDVPALARRIAEETGARVAVRDVDSLSAEAARAAARDAVARHPALIVAPSSELVFALRDETQAIPILFVALADPIQTSLVSDERRPRGNVSGFSFHVPIGPKQLEMLQRAFPSIRRVGVLGERTFFTSTSFRLLAQAARGPLALRIEPVPFESGADLPGAVLSGVGAGVDAWLVPEGGAAYRYAELLVKLVNRSGKPAIYGSERFVRLGGLMSYSPSFEGAAERVADMAKTVLQDFPVGDLPVERPQSFRLAINTRAWARFSPPPPSRLLLLANDFFPDEDGRP